MHLYMEESERHYASEISQTERDKYCMVSHVKRKNSNL